MLETERVILAEVYKQDGKLGINLPNERDVFLYELYGFLKCYLQVLEDELIDEFEPTDDDDGCGGYYDNAN